MKYFNQAKKNTTTIVIVYLGKKKQIIFPYAFGVKSVNSFLSLNPKYFLLCFVSRSFMVLTLKPIIHFGSIFV